MSNDTNNSLTDFDMCLALSQKAINSQMEAAWKSWIARSDCSTTGEMENFASVKIFRLNPKTNTLSPYGLEAELAPLTVSLFVPNGKLGQVKVTLNLESGTVTYFDEDAEEKGSYDFKNWKVSFLTDLDKQPCDLKLLEQIDPNVRGAIEAVIAKSGLPEDVFSIEYLFMKFTQVNLLLSDNKDIGIPDNVPKAARTKALTSLSELLQGKNGNFMLGTVVRRSKTNSEGELPTFALTDFTFNVKADPVSEASTLSYLGMFSRRPLPSNIDTARIALQDNWVRPDMLDGTKGLISGVMAISKSVFFDKFLIPKFTEQFRVKPDLEKLTYTYHLYNISNEEKDVLTNISSALKITIQPRTNQLQISGYIDGSASFTSYKNGKESAHVYLNSHQDVSTSVILTASGGTQNFQVEVDIPNNNYFGEIDVKVEKKSFVENPIEKIFLQTIEDMVEKVFQICNQQRQDLIRGSINDCLNAIDINLNNQVFIPPGGGVFTFQNLRFSDAGDLLFDVIYKTP